MTQEKDNGSNPPPRPPGIDPDKLDFSQFHPTGGHWPYSSSCHQYPGGGRQHLKYAWIFHYKPALRAATLCRLGLLHRWGDAWRGGPGPEGAKYLGKVCTYCHRRKRE